MSRCQARAIIDFAVAVADDNEADGVVYRLRSRGYQPGALLEQAYTDRTATARLVCAGTKTIVDLLFASSAGDARNPGPSGPGGIASV